LLKLLGPTQAFDVDDAPDTEPAPVSDQTFSAGSVCPCGSTSWRDLTIHDGQSLRRDCGRCGRFVGWPLWYGRRGALALEPAVSKLEASGKAAAHA
jgi:hypothetical protein